VSTRKRDPKAALQASMQQEEQATASRFEKAEGVFAASRDKQGKDQKAELVRISFAWLPDDVAEIERLRVEFYGLTGRNPSKAEIVRAGLASLIEIAKTSPAKFQSLVDSSVIERDR